MKHKSLLAPVLLFLSAAIEASQPPQLVHSDALFDLPLQQLMEIEIYTASQQTEKAVESASITSVITSQQLQQWGVRNVYEALSFIPGVVRNETYMGYSVLTFRGVTPGLFNNKALFMINGHPAYENLFGSSHLEYVPLEVIDRIEVVRTPASVLYGTQAVSGVVNVITRQGSDNDDVLTFRAGSHNHLYGSFAHYTDALSISGSLQNDDGYNFGGTRDEFGNPVELEYQNDLSNLFIDYHGDDWRINSGYFNLDEARFGFNPWVWQNGLNGHQAFYLDLNKTLRTNPGEMNAWLGYDYMDKEMHPGEFLFPADLAICRDYNIPADDPLTPEQEDLCISTNPLGKTDNHVTVYNTVERYSTELQYKSRISEDLRYIVGTNIEFYKTTPMDFIYDIDGTHHPIGGGFPDSHDSTTYTLYGQLDYQISTNLKTVAGLRTEKNSDAGYSGAVPRIGLTYRVKPGTYLKALYSEAYRTPIFLEKYIQVPDTLFGKIDLDRECIDTLELGLDSQINSNNNIQLALFWLELENEITRRPKLDTASVSDFEYFNAPGRKVYGIEAEWKTIPAESLEIIVNATLNRGEDYTLETLQPGFSGDVPFIARHTFNFMMNYHLTSHWTMSLSDQYVSEKDYVLTPDQGGEQGEVDAYNLLNLVLSYRKNHHEASIILRNLGDTDYTYPEPVRRNIPEIPGGPGATGYLRYSYKL